ncbi:MAG: tetratricopeptide repeat protein [Chloroflexi bacterium]|nr:tetratricopeptide repeat protein [Chloroflexota bacterium]
MGEGESYSDLGDLYFSMNQVEQAAELYKLSLKIAQENKNGLREIQSLTRLGDLHFDANELALAEKVLPASIGCHQTNERPGQ